MKIYQRATFVLLSLISGLVFSYYYFLYTNEYPGGSYQKIANYEAEKVFQTRLLVTSLANLFEPSVPLLRTMFLWAVPYPIDYETILQLLNALFVSSLILMMPKFLHVLGYNINPFASFLILLPVSWNYIAINGFFDGAGLYYPYDVPSLAFFALGVILHHQKKWFWFYPVFMLALLNRESACFISLAGFLLAAIPSKTAAGFLNQNRALLLHILAQTLLWGASRIFLSYAFRGNPGEFFEAPHSMIAFLSQIPSASPHWAMENPRWFLTIFAGIWIIPLLNFKHLNQPTKRLLWVGIIYLAALFFRSNMMEVRVYNELNVILYATAISGACGFQKSLSSSSKRLNKLPVS